MKNQGKVFEENFRKSLDLNSPDIFYYRLKDNPASFGNSNNQFIRFTSNNIADSLLYYKKTLFILELKNHKGKSLPLTCIRDNQLKEMFEASLKSNVFPLLIIFFSDLEECYALPIQYVKEIKTKSTSKSIPILLCREKGFKIEVKKLKTNYRYDIIKFLDTFIDRIK